MAEIGYEPADLTMHLLLRTTRVELFRIVVQYFHKRCFKGILEYFEVILVGFQHTQSNQISDKLNII